MFRVKCKTMNGRITRILACTLIALFSFLTAHTIFTPSYSSTALTTQIFTSQQNDLSITTTTYVSSAGKEIRARIERINAEIKLSNQAISDMDFMIAGPKLEAVKKMRVALKARLALIGMIDANKKKKYQA